MAEAMVNRIYMIVICAVLIVTGCSTDSSDTDDSLFSYAHHTKAYHDDLPGLLEKKYIRVLTTLNRTNFFISEGHLVGYEYALLKDYEKHLNRQIQNKDLKIVLEFIPVARDQLMLNLLNGYGDIAAAGLTITEGRKKKVNFTDPYLTDVDEIVVTTQGKFALNTLDDLSGETVYVRKSSSYYQSLVQLNDHLRRNRKRAVKIQLLSEDLETESILEMVNSGAIGITVADSHIARIWSGILENITVHDDIILREGSQIAWMVRKENPELLASLNEFLKTRKKGTLFGNIYFDRYFNSMEMLNSPSVVQEWEKVKKYQNLILKYAEAYDFDWRLILAVAFQESGLNHSRKSRAGAVGLMQVLPSTARDKKINIDRIDRVENNIHAGVKYLAFLRDHYFSDETISPRARLRFTLAAYNAGPAKIQDARALAQTMGLDENRWFRNVEIAVLRTVGQETVRYVSNINKYYALYQVLIDPEPEADL